MIEIKSVYCGDHDSCQEEQRNTGGAKGQVPLSTGEGFAKSCCKTCGVRDKPVTADKSTRVDNPGLESHEAPHR